MVVMQLLAYQVWQSASGRFFHDWSHHATGLWQTWPPDRQPACYQTSRR